MAAVFDDFGDSELISLINDGAVGVIPTDTIYGLVCQATNQPAVERLYNLKSRQNKPGTVIAASIDQLVDLGLKARYLKAVEEYWPGPISVLIPSTTEDLSYLLKGQSALAVRLPADKRLAKLLKKTGPLLTSSANQPGKEPARNVEEAGLYFGGKVDFYVDGGKLENQPSTIIRVVDDEIEVIREGAVKFKDHKIVS